LVRAILECYLCIQIGVVRYRILFEYLGMRASREAFEKAPDDGFFGKSCARIINLIEVYIFRFLFVGIFMILMCFTFVCVMNIMFTIFLMVTMVIWATFLMIGLYSLVYYGRMLLQTFLMDLDCELFGQVRDDVQTSQPFFPIFFELFGRIIGLGVLQIVWAAILLALHIVFGVILIIWAVFCFTIRSIYDCILFQFIKCFGRIPRRDTTYAWKSSGPGISRKFFYRV
jgi:hypothetical protein